jgi:hypothetical protein
MTAPSSKPPDKRIYRLRLQAMDSDDNDIRHLRALLKVLLRRYHFRVVEIEQEPAP